MTTQSIPEGTATPKSPIKILGFALLFISLVLVFTLFKLPQLRITSLLQGYIQLAFDPYGVYITDRGRELSLMRGLQYTLDHPTFELADQTRIELDDFVIRPKFIPLLSGKISVNASLHQGASSIIFDGAGRADKIDASLTLDRVELGKFGVFSYLANLKGNGALSGTINILGALSDPTSLNGLIDLKLKNLKLDEQNLMGFQLPTLLVTEGTILIEIQNGKLLMKKVQLGKGADDLKLDLSGDIVLNRNLNSSTLNLRTGFSLSDRVKQSLALLDSIIGPAKKADGSYAYKLTGTFSSPFPIPDSSQVK